jgi:hypothetical protein
VRAFVLISPPIPSKWGRGRRELQKVDSEKKQRNTHFFLSLRRMSGEWRRRRRRRRVMRTQMKVEH